MRLAAWKLVASGLASLARGETDKSPRGAQQGPKGRVPQLSVSCGWRGDTGDMNPSTRTERQVGFCGQGGRGLTQMNNDYCINTNYVVIIGPN